MTILAIDTSSEACSASLLTDTGVINRFVVAPRKHTQLILPMIDEVLEEAGLNKNDLSMIAFGYGPGAFTGVRIATAIAQGLGFSLNVPVVPVSCLAAIAQQAIDSQRAERVLTAIDARMGEVYWSTYEKDASGLAKQVTNPLVIDPAEIVMPDIHGWIRAGSGWLEYEQQLQRISERCDPAKVISIYPRAEDIARLAAAAEETDLITTNTPVSPLYLRNNVAKKSQPRVQPG